MREAPLPPEKLITIELLVMAPNVTVDCIVGCAAFEVPETALSFWIAP